jgi:uncharacterized protein (DUF983 family)
MKFLCPHCGNGAMRILFVGESAVGIECLRCGKDSVLQTPPPAAAPADAAAPATPALPSGTAPL